MRIITDRDELIALSRELGTRANWHEPDEQGLTARVEGMTFDNAGFWPTAEALQPGFLTTRSVELHVIISREAEDCDECGHGDTVDVAAVNLATLLAWATGYRGE